MSHTTCVITLCATKLKKKLQKDGSIIETEILPIKIAADHRYFDGMAGSKLMKIVSLIILIYR